MLNTELYKFMSDITRKTKAVSFVILLYHQPEAISVIRRLFLFTMGSSFDVAIARS